MCPAQPLDTTGVHGSLLVVEKGMLMRKFIKRDGTSDSHQLIVPRELQKEVLQNAHDGLLGGHLGQKKTREKAQQEVLLEGYL